MVPTSLNHLELQLVDELTDFPPQKISVYLILLLQVLSHNNDFLSYNFDIFNVDL